MAVSADHPLVRALVSIGIAALVAAGISYVRGDSLGGALALGVAIGIGVAVGILGFEALTRRAR